MKRILDHKTFINNRELRVDEAFTNDIPWGDSLIGRLINSIARKTKVAYNKKRIESVLKRLESHFDQMIEIGNIEVEEEVLEFTKISTYFGQLKSQVEEGEDIEVLVSTLELLLGEVENSDSKNKDVLKDAIVKFVDYLESLEEGSADEGGEEKESAESDEDIQKKKNEFYSHSRKFLQSIVEIAEIIEQNKKQAQPQKQNVQNKIQIGREYIYTNKEGKKSRVKVISLTNVKGIGGDKKWITKDDKTIEPIEKGTVSVAFQDKSGNYLPNTNAVDPKNLVPVKESSRLNEANDVSEEASGKAWKNITNSYSKSQLNKHIPEIKKLLDTKEEDPNYGKNKEFIILICKQVVKNLITLGKPVEYTELIKEGLYDNDIPKSISLFNRYILTIKDGMGLLGFGNLNKAKQPIENLLNTFENMKKFLVEDKKEPVKEKGQEGENKEAQKEPQKQNASFSYQNFLLILEKNKYIKEIKAKFDEIFKDDLIKEYQIDESKKAKLDSSVKKSEIYRITDFDLVEISRIFNRAFRLHTPGAIPSGRSEGRVSVSVFNEYEYVGEGSAGSPNNPGSGPYRNKKIFDTWEDGVKKRIITNPKYRPLFTEETMIVQDGKDIGKKKKLLAFMETILEESAVYRKDGMSKLLLDYFGVENKRISGSVEKEDEFGNAKTAGEIKISQVDFSPLSGDDSKTERALYKLVAKSGEGFGQDAKRNVVYFRALKITNDHILGVLTEGFPYDRTNMELKTPPTTARTPKYFICKFNKSDFFNKKLNGTFMSHGNVNDSPQTYPNLSFEKVFILKSEDKPFTEVKFRSDDQKSESQMEFDKYLKKL